MSAPSSRPPNQPNGKPGAPVAAPRRARPKTDPFGWKKQQVSKPKAPLKKAPATANGTTYREPSVGPGSLDSQQKLRELEEKRRQNNGWSTPTPPEAKVSEFKVFTTKRELLDGIRYHIMKFNRPQDDPNPVDPTDQEQFPRPVSLHRRNAQQNPGAKALQEEKMEPLNGADDAESERLRLQKEQREAQRALDQAQIATVMKNNEPKARNNKKPKLTTYYKKDSDAHKKQAQLHYEETMPWHLEDVDRKNVWVGSYIAALSDVNCALVIDGYHFRMIPLQRHYKFDEKPNFHTLTLDEAEKAMKEEGKMTRWMMAAEQQTQEAKKEKQETRVFLGGRARVKTESSTSRAAPRSERADDYELDMEGEEFQDDDEAPGFDADDEDTRETKDRVRRDQLGANMFGEGDEDEVDKELEAELQEKKRRKELGKDTRKRLMKHEHALDYDNDDSDDEENDNPFSDTSEDEEEDEEEKKEEDGKKPEAKEQPASGSTTKGTNTPSGAKKVSDSAKKGKSLKRPGSPNLSESSGNESSRKKKAKTTSKRPTSLVPSRSSTPLSNKARAGAGSDGEGSDGGKPKVTKLKVTNTSATGTPSASRAGSPVPSPAKAEPSAPLDQVQPAEVRAAIARYPEGIKVTDLLKIFNKRIDKPGHITRTVWLQMVKECGVWGADKLIRPKQGA